MEKNEKKGQILQKHRIAPPGEAPVNDPAQRLLMRAVEPVGASQGAKRDPKGFLPSMRKSHIKLYPYCSLCYMWAIFQTKTCTCLPSIATFFLHLASAMWQMQL